MENLTASFNAIMPIFLIIISGYISRCAGIIKREYIPAFNKVAFKVFFPVMIFNNIYKSDLSQAIRPKLIVFAVVGIICGFFISRIIAIFISKDEKNVGVVMQGIFRSNYAAVGLPIAVSLCGNEDVSAVSVLLAIVVPVFNVLGVLCLEIYNGKKVNIKETTINILKNPLIIGSVLGILALLLKIKLPFVGQSAVDSISKVGSPLMLFLLGAFFKFDTIKNYVKELVGVCFARLVLFPGIFLTIGALIGFSGVEFAALLGVFASSTAINSFTMAQEMGGDAELAGNIVIITSAICSLTMFLWCVVFKSFGVL